MGLNIVDSWKVRGTKIKKIRQANTRKVAAEKNKRFKKEKHQLLADSARTIEEKQEEVSRLLHENTSLRNQLVVEQNRHAKSEKDMQVNYDSLLTKNKEESVKTVNKRVRELNQKISDCDSLKSELEALRAEMVADVAEAQTITAQSKSTIEFLRQSAGVLSGVDHRLEHLQSKVTENGNQIQKKALSIAGRVSTIQA